MKTVTVAAAFIVDNDRVLACRRSDGAQAGFFELPGGKVEPGEGAEAACRREVAEELGCTLGAMWPLESVEYDYPDFHLSMEVFYASLAPGQEPVATVHDELRWLSRDELGSVEWLPADRGLMEAMGLWWNDVLGDH